MSSARQLAAIMFTDIVGYTALMGRDERTAFTLLDKNRQLQKPIIDTFRGKFIKELGDGIMASFNTVSDAVNAAIQIQEAAHKENTFQLRIGIHSGEVVFENEDVFGDGVNIASRIQAVAAPGAIYISETVQQNIANKKDIRTRFVTTQKLKNVKEPVKIYEVVTRDSRPQSHISYKQIPRGKIITVTSIILLLLVAGYISTIFFQNKKISGAEYSPKKSIAILPFTDNSPGRDQAYLGDGIAEEITHSLTILENVKVIGSASSSRYKNEKITPKEIGDKLKVGVVLEGSIQKAGNILRITAQLINVEDNSTIWSQQFDREMKDIFAIQDSIALHIVEKLKLTLTEEDNSRLTKKTTNDETYQLFLKGIYTYKEGNFDEAIGYLSAAINKDSLFAPSYSWMALSKTWKIIRAKLFNDLSLIHEAKDYANTAIRLDPFQGEAYSALALMAWGAELDFPAAKTYFEKSLQINPGASLLKNRYGYFLLWMGDFDRAIGLGKEAIELDPVDNNGYIIVANGYKYKKQFRQAAAFIAEGKKLFPSNKAFINLEKELAFSENEFDKLKKLGIDTSEMNLNFISNLGIAYLKTGDPQKADFLMETIRMSDEQKFLNKNFALARFFVEKGSKDSAFYFLEKSCLAREPEFKLLKIDPVFVQVHGDKRYLDLYQRYGFARYDQLEK